MHRIVAGLSVWCAFFLIGAAALGFLADRPGPDAGAAAGGGLFEWHFLAGIFSSVFALVVHGIVMTWFLAMGGFVKEGGRILGGEAAEAFRLRSRRIKMRASPPATFAPVAVVVTAVVGGATGDAMASSGWHGWLAVATILYNLHAFRKEYAAVVDQSALTRDVDAALAARK